MEKYIVLTVDLRSKKISFQPAAGGVPSSAPIRILFFESASEYYGQVIISGKAQEFYYSTKTKTGILHDADTKLLARHVPFPSSK